MNLPSHFSGYARVHATDAVLLGWCEYVAVGGQDMVCVQGPGNQVDWLNLAHVHRITALSELHYRELVGANLTPESLLAAVAARCNVPAARLQSDCRDAETSLARFFFYRLARECLPPPHNTFSAIGRFIDRDHGAVCGGVQRLGDLMETEPTVRARYEDMRAALQFRGTEELVT